MVNLALIITRQQILYISNGKFSIKNYSTIFVSPWYPYLCVTVKIIKDNGSRALWLAMNQKLLEYTEYHHLPVQKHTDLTARADRK